MRFKVKDKVILARFLDPDGKTANHETHQMFIEELGDTYEITKIFANKHKGVSHCSDYIVECRDAMGTLSEFSEDELELITKATKTLYGRV